MSKRNFEEKMPSSEQFEVELIRVRYKQRYLSLLKNTVYSLLVVAAVSVLIATLVLPVLEIHGTSMNPTFENGDIVVSVKTTDLEKNDVCCFYYNNHILVKRVIATQGDVVNMDDDGNVYVNGVLLEEPYVSKKELGQCDLEFPYTVPERTVFVLGDNRSTSVDSRNALIGCVSLDEVVGKIVFCVWPLPSFGFVR